MLGQCEIGVHVELCLFFDRRLPFETFGELSPLICVPGIRRIDGYVVLPNAGPRGWDLPSIEQFFVAHACDRIEKCAIIHSPIATTHITITITPDDGIVTIGAPALKVPPSSLEFELFCKVGISIIVQMKPRYVIVIEEGVTDRQELERVIAATPKHVIEFVYDAQFEGRLVKLIGDTVSEIID